MIGGNTTALIERMADAVKNEIGETVPGWAPVGLLTGWLDLMSGGAGPAYTT